MKYILSFRESSEGGAVTPGMLTQENGQTIPATDLRLASKIVFLVHGYNVDEAEGKDKLLRLADMLPSMQDAAFVATLWPGDHWMGGLSYPLEWRDARDTSTRFARFIGDNLRREVPLYFVTHSLGARVAMDTIRSVWQSGFNVKQICLMAPAIDDDSLSDFRVYRRATEEADRVTVLSSVNDEILGLAYPVGDLLYTAFHENEYWDLALGYHGPKSEPDLNQSVPGNVFHVPTPDDRGVDHGDYLPEQTPNDEQESAAAFADKVLTGMTNPQYI